METRTVRVKAFPYFETEPHPLIEGKQREIRKFARRGDTIDLADSEAARGDALGAFVEESELEDSDGELLEFSAATPEEIAEWLKSARPTIAAVLTAVENDPEVAVKVIEAEGIATGEDPRPTLIARLNRLIEDQTEG